MRISDWSSDVCSSDLRNHPYMDIDTPTPDPSCKREGGDLEMTETKIRPRPAAVTLSAKAEARVAGLMASAPEGAIGVKLSTPRRGCSGLAYSVDYVTAEDRFHETLETPRRTSTK